MSNEEKLNRLYDRFLSRYLIESHSLSISDIFSFRIRTVISDILIRDGEDKAIDFVERAKLR